MSLDIEGMVPADWEQVRAIYLDGIASGQATFEVEAPPWEQWDAAHHPFARLVARANGRVVGWAALSPVSRRRCYAGVAEVSVYVAAEHRGRGIGRQLLLAVIAESERRGIWMLQGATFPENEASLRLQRACGFREIGRRERIAQLRGIWRDTVLTERRSSVVGVGPNPMAATITRERPDSADARVLITELEAHLEPLYPTESRHGYSVAKLIAQQVAFFVLRDDGTPAGCGGIQLFGAEYGELKRMYVRPQFRGLGYGKLLLDHLADHARAHGVGILRLETGIHQAAAIHLYERVGFQRIPPFGDYRKAPLSLFYEKRIT